MDLIGMIPRRGSRLRKIDSRRHQLSLSFRSSGMSGHIRTFAGRQDDRNSLGKCNSQVAKTSVRTQSGHFRLHMKDVKLSFCGSFQAHDQAYDEAYDQAYDEAYDEAYDQAYDAIDKIYSLTRQTEN